MSIDPAASARESPSTGAPLRILLVYPAMPLSFWSRPLALGIVDKRSVFPPLGLLTVAALLPAHWPVRLVDLNVRPLTEEDWSWAQVVMLSAMYVQRTGLLALVREAGRRGKISVAGGPYPTSMAGELVDAGCRFVVRGEAEACMSVLVDRLANGTGETIVEVDGRPDLALSPVPRFDLVEPGDYVNGVVQTSRGCPNACEFCDVISLYGRVPRYKSPAQVVSELEALHRHFSGGAVFICDDNFLGAPAPARAILEAITGWNRQRGEPFGFSTQTTMSLGRDLDMIDRLTAANFGEIFVGVESVDEEVLSRANKPRGGDLSAAELLTNICRNGLTVMPSFIVGLDGEQPGCDRRIEELVEEVAAPMPMINLLGAPPGTQLWQRLQSEGRLRPDVTVERASLASMNFVPLRPEEEILAEHRALWDRLYEPGRFIDRAYRYYMRMRPTRAALARARGETCPGVQGAPLPLADRLGRLLQGLRVVLCMGGRATGGLGFFRRLAGIARGNPSRLAAFVIACASGPDLLRLRRLVLESRPARPRSMVQ